MEERWVAGRARPAAGAVAHPAQLGAACAIDRNRTPALECQVARDPEVLLRRCTPPVRLAGNDEKEQIGA
jgi:hypothetical protein